MKRRVEDWSLEKLSKKRSIISFPEYQRERQLWSDERKSLLIDSILKDIDIPKLYFNETHDGMYEVVDGQQRLWAIWDFLDDKYAYQHGNSPQTFSQLTPRQRDTLREYKLQITVFKNADDDYLRTLFVRLQLGLLLITGERLNAATGEMKDFVFRTLVRHPFVQKLGMPSRRFAKETLCAQICINSFAREKIGSFTRTRYEDLEQFFKEYEQPQGKDRLLFQSQTGRIKSVLDELWHTFGDKASDLKNRSYILSIYLLVEDLIKKRQFSSRDRDLFAEFALKLWKRLREESGAGFDRKNRELYSFQTSLSSAPGEKYQIERRHDKLLNYYTYFKETKKIKGDR